MQIRKIKYLSTGGSVVARQKIWTGISVLILAMVFYTSTAKAHGKVAIEEDNCMRQIGENMIHLSAYQPQIDEEGHYCTDIPKVGHTGNRPSRPIAAGYANWNQSNQRQ